MTTEQQIIECAKQLAPDAKYVFFSYKLRDPDDIVTVAIYVGRGRWDCDLDRCLGEGHGATLEDAHKALCALLEARLKESEAYDLSTPEGCKRALDAGALNSAEYRMCLDELAPARIGEACL